MAAAKLERLMNLIAALLHTSVPLSAAELKLRVGGYAEGQVAFHKQFSRDKKDLRDMGVLIRVEPVPDSDPPVDGYRIDPQDYYLADPGLDADELAALHLATRLISVGNPDGERLGLFKLGGLTGEGDRVTPMAAMPQDGNLGMLFDAVSRHLIAEFVYHDSERHFAPRGLGFRGGNWYVSGWDIDHGHQRLFRLDRIQGSVALGGDAGDIPGDAGEIGPLQPWTIGDFEPVRVTIASVPSSLGEILAQVGEGAVVGADDRGRPLVEITVTNRDGFRSWVLGFGDSVEVIGPPETRQAIREWLERFGSEDR